MGIVSKLENSTIELKCPICNSEETCNTSEYNCNYILIFQIDDLEVLYQNILILELHELVPQTCRSSQKCCFTKIKYGMYLLTFFGPKKTTHVLNSLKLNYVAVVS